MATKTGNAIVQQPNPNYRAGEWNWHVWERLDKVTERWLGFFFDADTALAWARSKPGNYHINNVPPESSNQRVRNVWKENNPGATTARPKRKTSDPFKVKTPTRPTAPAPKAAPVDPRAAAELRAAKADAQVIYDQHHADEAKELAEQDQNDV